jgi:hypothetical protein
VPRYFLIELHTVKIAQGKNKPKIQKSRHTKNKKIWAYLDEILEDILPILLNIKLTNF